MNRYYPEGHLIDTPRNQNALRTAAGLAEAALDGRVLEARAVLCDAEHNLHVELPCMEGIIPYYDGAVGIAEGTTRDIALISRVSKPVCFVVKGFEDTPGGGRRAVLSRREAQEKCRAEYLDALRCGDIIPARVTRLESFGAFCDVGCGLPALMPIASLSVSRISHPSDRFAPGMDILGVVSSWKTGGSAFPSGNCLVPGRRTPPCLSRGKRWRELSARWRNTGCLWNSPPTLPGWPSRGKASGRGSGRGCTSRASCRTR